MKYLKLTAHKIAATTCPCCQQEQNRIGIEREFIFSYRDILLKQLRENPQGANLDFMEMALTVLKKVRAVQPGQWLVLEDAEMAHLQGVMSGVNYFVNDEVIVNFIKAVRNPLNELPESAGAVITHAPPERFNGKVTEQIPVN